MTNATDVPSGDELVEVRSATNRQCEKPLPACRRIAPWAPFSASARSPALCSLPHLLANADVDRTIVNVAVIQRYVWIYAMKSRV